MSIPLPRELREIESSLLDPAFRITVPWFLDFADGTCAFNLHDPWSDHADSASIDGLSVFLTRKYVRDLYIYPEQRPRCTPIHLCPAEPCPCFAFTRYSQGLSGDFSPTWLYTIFGYALADMVFLLKVLPNQTETHLLPRPLHFDL